MKNLVYTCTLILVAMTFVACNQGRIEELEKENAQLRSQLDTLKTRKILRAPITPDQAQAFTTTFRSTDSVQIPLAWTFDASELGQLASTNAKIRFYAGQDSTAGNMLKLIAVGVNEANDDLTDMMFDFAETCPGTLCPANTTILYNPLFPLTHDFTSPSN